MDTNILKRLAANGLRVSVKNKACSVELRFLGTADPLCAREILYRALNGLEPYFDVFIKGIPFCFMPDAWDHILYRKKGGAACARIRACGACRLKGLCPGLERKSVFYTALRRELAPVLSAPREVVIELTEECNQNCRICFTDRRGGGRSLKELRGILRQAKELGVRNIRFTGGEPFLSRHLLPLLKAAKAAGFYTLVNTNATAADAAKLEKTAAYIDNVLVSLQGRDEHSEHAATGIPGLFSRKLKNIGVLKAGGVKILRLGTVVSRDIIKDFSSYYRLAGRLKADIWELYRPMLKKETLSRNKKFDLAKADIKRLSGRISSLGSALPRAVIANPVPLCAVPAAERKNFLGSAFDDGRTRLVYDARGFFKPSYCIEENLGPLLKKAWASRFLKRLNADARLPGRCKACSYLLKCHGGSRFLANAGGRPAADPWFPGQRAGK